MAHNDWKWPEPSFEWESPPALPATWPPPLAQWHRSVAVTIATGGSGAAICLPSRSRPSFCIPYSARDSNRLGAAQFVKPDAAE